MLISVLNLPVTSVSTSFPNSGFLPLRCMSAFVFPFLIFSTFPRFLGPWLLFLFLLHLLVCFSSPGDLKNFTWSVFEVVPEFSMLLNQVIPGGFLQPVLGFFSCDSSMQSVPFFFSHFWQFQILLVYQTLQVLDFFLVTLLIWFHSLVTLWCTK